MGVSTCTVLRWSIPCSSYLLEVRSEEDGRVPNGTCTSWCLTQLPLSLYHIRSLPESTSLEANAEPSASAAQEGPESQQFLGAA